MYLFHEKHLDTLVTFFQSLVPLADKTVYLTVPGLDKALSPLGESLGFEIGMLKVCIYMHDICTYPPHPLPSPPGCPSTSLWLQERHLFAPSIQTHPPTHPPTHPRTSSTHSTS